MEVLAHQNNMFDHVDMDNIIEVFDLDDSYDIDQYEFNTVLKKLFRSNQN